MLPICGKFSRALRAHPIFSSKKAFFAMDHTFDEGYQIFSFQKKSINHSLCARPNGS
jgi:hypothetical protein